MRLPSTHTIMRSTHAHACEGHRSTTTSEGHVNDHDCNMTNKNHGFEITHLYAYMSMDKKFLRCMLLRINPMVDNWQDLTGYPHIDYNARDLLSIYCHNLSWSSKKQKGHIWDLGGESIQPLGHVSRCFRIRTTVCPFAAAAASLRHSPS